MPWGDYLNTGSVTLREAVRTPKGVKRVGRERSVGVGDRDWRSAENRAVPTPLARAGTDFVRSHVKDLIIVGARTTTPPPCHVETPGG